ncbi:hypothetical protein HW561_03335 [Rhodobacteraceae bacterium B1Z28]|uniref:Chemotaxis protein CheA n=1 Tax=Ruegeria haliotis TaxID=2747601 RepID=A0ABX2PL57_9RHOB|nr:hypothetical protein [Ruegeria haliotis]NVO54819.1 hypothetical protein [Ruegeria haliotis]
MVQNNKVLTVSYGTFSCTLEGFDDSFETMKAIAEYFRDLAADDRYFGSEPPQPDAEMLTRIAQRDASQQVEARQSETGLLLRATETTPAPAPTAPQEPAERAAELNVVEAPAPEQTRQAETRPVFAEAEPVAVAPAPPADSIAAKLQRIRAVVSHSNDTPGTYSEDDDSALLDNVSAPVDAVSAAFEAGALSIDDLAPEEPTEALQPDAMDEPKPAQVPVIEGELEEEVQPAGVLFSDLDEATEADAEEDGIINILSDEDPVDQLEETNAEDMQDEPAQGVLTAEDEANLLNEISKIETDMSDRASQKLTDEADPDQDVSRLMDMAGAHMADPTTSDTRETYSHLRTAVVATEAERQDKDGADQASEDQDYRGDLASVVSPRRPEIQVTSMRPESDSSAPLKLVAEQRIDDQHEETGPVMPRRVTTPQDENTSEEGGFAQFAQDQGAQSLPDLLEAAAAYLSFIEGQEQFSRPQLMNKVRSLKQDEFNREESLRSFGQLLRDGKIEKAGGGRFAASNLIGFRPDDERAVG